MVSVFISHSSRDSEVALRLAQDLKQNGHDIWLDKWSIHVGESISASIEQGLENASFLLLLLSRHGVASSWVEREWRAAYWNEVDTKGVRVLPVLLEPCSIPQLLRDKKYIALFPDYAQGLQEILSALDHLRREQSRKSFYARVPDFWRSEVEGDEQFRQARNVHWDNFNNLVDALPSVERRKTQELNTKHYLEMYDLSISQLKQALKDIGFFNGVVDDEYEDAVVLSIERFQRAFNLRHVDGVFGPLTYAAMAAVANPK